MAKKRREKEKPDFFMRATRFGTIAWSIFTAGFTLLFILLIFGLISLPGSGELGSGDVAVLRVEGPIVTSGAGGVLSGSVASADTLVRRIRSLDEDESIRGLIVEINSPGGSAVASDEIGQALKEFSKPNVAVIREVGASGGYWIASAADHIFANRMSLTGSIGVIGSSFGLEGLLDDYNVTYRRLVAGHLKDAGTPFREMTLEEERLLQSLVNGIYDEFVDEVAMNRDLPRERVIELATGFVYLGKDAVDLGLVDDLGGIDEAKAWMEEELNSTVRLAYFREHTSLLDAFSGVTSKNFESIGVGIGRSLRPDESLRVELR